MASKYEYCKSKMDVKGSGFEYTTEAGDKVFLSHEDLIVLSYFKDFTNTSWYLPWLKYKVKEKE